MHANENDPINDNPPPPKRGNPNWYTANLGAMQAARNRERQLTVGQVQERWLALRGAKVTLPRLTFLEDAT